MPGFTAVVTPEDLKKGDLVDPGSYPMELVDYIEEEAKTDKSVNLIFKFKIFDGPNKGVSPQFRLNEKALGFGKELWVALGIPFDKEKGYNLSSDMMKAQVGKKVKGYIKRGKGNNDKEFNELVGFEPLVLPK